MNAVYNANPTVISSLTVSNGDINTTGSINLTLGNNTGGHVYIGPNGTTNPTLYLATGVAGVVTGLQITPAAAGSSVTLSVISSAANEDLIIDAKGAGDIFLQSTATGNVVLGKAVALATDATNGFAHIPSMAGTPTGTPTAFTGKTPMVYDTSANKLWFYNGSWRGVAVT